MSELRTFLRDNMTRVYDKYHEKKPKTMSVPDFINKLNNKSIKDCIDIYSAKKKSREKQKNVQHFQQQPRQQQPTQASSLSSSIKQNPISSLDAGFQNSALGFAPITSTVGGYYTADGRMGDGQMKFETNNESNNSRSGKNSDELDQLMYSRRQAYDNKPIRAIGMGNNRSLYDQPGLEKNDDTNFPPWGSDSNIGGFGDMGNMGNMGDMGNMNNTENLSGNNMQQNPLQYNPNIDGRNTLPPEIDFTGGNGRNRQNPHQQQQQPQQQSNGFGSYDPNQFAMSSMGINQQGEPQEQTRDFTSDPKKLLGKFIQERDIAPTSVAKPAQFNPKISPIQNQMGLVGTNMNLQQMLQFQQNYQQQQNSQKNMSGQNKSTNSNFIKGEKGGSVPDFREMSTIELEKFLKKKHETSIDNIDNILDLNKIQYLSSKDIGKIIKKLTTNDSQSNLDTKSKKHIKFKSESEDEVESEHESKIKPKLTKKIKKKLEIKSESESKYDSDTKSENESESESDSEKYILKALSLV